MSFDVLLVANYLVGLDREAPRKRRLTNMALQKLLYFAEGEHLAERGRSLFDIAIEAWEYGPVVPDAYHAFKLSGSKPIDKPASTLDTDGRVWRWVTPTLPTQPNTRYERELLARIYKKLGTLPAARLMAASHAKGGPWSQVYQQGMRHVEIPRPMLQQYFKAHPV